MLAGKGVGRVDMAVAEQTELSRVSSAVEDSEVVIAEVAGDGGGFWKKRSRRSSGGFGGWGEDHD